MYACCVMRTLDTFSRSEYHPLRFCRVQVPLNSSYMSLPEPSILQFHKASTLVPILENILNLHNYSVSILFLWYRCFQETLSWSTEIYFFLINFFCDRIYLLLVNCSHLWVTYPGRNLLLKHHFPGSQKEQSPGDLYER